MFFTTDPQHGSPGCDGTTIAWCLTSAQSAKTSKHVKQTKMQHNSKSQFSDVMRKTESDPTKTQQFNTA